jgi:hypothetical protein
MNKKKVIIYLSTITIFLIVVLYLSISFFKENYKEEVAVVERFDEYGNAYLNNGEVIQFRGFFICNNGQEYYWENLNELLRKSLKIEYRINEEGYKKVEKFYVDGVECIKTSGGRGGYGSNEKIEEKGDVE